MTRKQVSGSESLSQASSYWRVRERPRGTVSSSSRFQTTLFQQCSASLSSWRPPDGQRLIAPAAVRTWDSFQYYIFRNTYKHIVHQFFIFFPFRQFSDAFQQRSANLSHCPQAALDADNNSSNNNDTDNNDNTYNNHIHNSHNNDTTIIPMI